MDDDTFFSELRLNGKRLENCEMALECNRGNYRLYVDREADDNTFYSMAIEFVSCLASEVDIWRSKELRVNQLFNTTAYYDGVRHLEFNREAGDMAGYIYYPNIQGLTDLFIKLREIEISVCRDCE